MNRGRDATGRRGFWIAVLLTYAVVAGVFVLRHVLFGTDYVALDNDDTMRLVQVRDLLAGQGWFDLTQVRLGLDGGTLMHWSRLVDLPIANLVTLFAHFTTIETAEALALAAWPLLLLFVLLAAMGLAGKRLAGDHGLFGALVLTAMFAVASGRFSPGSIDHHNAQMALIALALAGLVDGRMRAGSFALAGVATALAIALGAEIVPHMAIVCAAAALIWAVRGEAARAGAMAFGLALTATLTAVFFATVPPARYGVVVCDAYSAGFYTLGALGGGLLFLSAVLVSSRPAPARFAALALTGAAVAAAAVIVAPHCLQSPLADLDPMLRAQWLSFVTEAQPFAGVWRRTPELLAGQYLLAAAAIVLALRMALRGERRQANLVLLGVLSVAFAISLVQVRGAPFANLVAVLVFAQIVAGARRALRADPKSGSAALRFCLAVILSAQLTWTLGGIGIAAAVEKATGEDWAGRATRGDVTAMSAEEACRAGEAMAVLGAEPAGVVSAVSNIGDDILRHTPHRVLSAPYHRNQGGMLTQLHIAQEAPATAAAFLRGAGVTHLVHCPGDPETQMMVRNAPDGLAAAIERGAVPAYLEPLAATPSMSVFRVR